MMKELFGEFLGTLILILLGNGVVAGVVLPKTKSHNSGWIVMGDCSCSGSLYLWQVKSGTFESSGDDWGCS